jgi:hypothetical protein
MRKSLGFGFPFLGLLGAALAAAGSIGGCSSSSASPVLSAAGESCGRTADCGSGLVCVSQTCVTRDAGVPALAEAGVVFPPEAGAAAAPAREEGGAPEAAPPPRVSDLGESCSITSDCAAGLVCIPSASGAGGTCDRASYGLKATGKTCSGECVTGADCCELPLGITVTAGAVKTCQDILGLVLGGNMTQCAAAAPASDVGVGCFLYATYCSTCASSGVWSCTASQCVYAASCQNDGVVFGGCPTQTRTGRPLAPFCDGTAHKCQSTPRGICNMDADCNGKGTTDGAGTCRGGDCACYAGGCYYSCASTLDCAQGTTCDANLKVCTQGGTCSSDAQCASQTGAVNAKCVGGACKLSCTSDRQCGGSGLVQSPSSDAGAPAGSFADAFGGEVCGADGFCEDLGCATNADCQELNHNMNPGGSALNYFCVTPPVVTPTPTPASAITN